MRTPFFPLFGACALSACVLGPDYQGPPSAALRAETGAPFVRAGEGADAREPAHLQDWISALNEPELDALIAAALAENPNLAGVAARLRQARAGLREARRRSWPTGGVRAGYERTQPSFAGFGADALGVEARDLDLYDVTLDARWEIDLFGVARRGREAARARAAAAALELADAQISIAAETAFAFIDLRAAEQRLAIAEAAALLQQDLADLVALREANGADSRLNLDRARYRSAEIRAALPGYRAETDVQRDRLAVLVGREPGALDGLLVDAPAAPSEIARAFAIGDAGALLRRRPDVRAAERRLQAANAGIGAALGDYFPRVSLIGSIGGQTNRADDFGPEAFTYRVGPTLEWSILDIEAISARVEGARGRTDEAVAAYRETVLGALADAEAALARYNAARERLALAREARDHAASAASRADLRYRAGAASLSETLEAERDRLASELFLVDARVDLARAHISLAKSLGVRVAPQIQG